MNLKNKSVIITGGASGIGLATVKKMLKLGASVMIADWSENGSIIKNELNNDNVIFMKTDVSNEEDVKKMINKTIDAFGKIDVVVSNAGIGGGNLPHEETLENWNHILGINLTGVFLTDKYAIEQMLKQKTGGSIIHMASILGFVGNPRAFTYSVAKGGIINMTRSMSLSYAKDNIRVNAIAPGYIDTPILGNMDENTKNMIIGLHPLGRLGKDTEIADAVCFLASDESSFITGITMPVDGGYLAQ
ncbi:MAG: SDR family oxidoreductase [Bacilli bacterium]